MTMTRQLYRRQLALRMHFVTLCCIAFAGLGRAQQPIVVGYYPMWAKGALPASQVIYSSLTHINHAFAWPNMDGTLAFDDAVVDTSLINTTHRAGRKILLSLGGAGTVQTANFSTVCADSNLRHAFVSNLVSHLVAGKYDGADLDWEGPASTADRLNEVLLVRELRAALDVADTSLLLTMAVGVGNWSQQWRDFNSLRPYVKWFAAMMYDFYGSWSATTGHNSPLFAPANTDGNINDALAYLSVTRQIPAGKLLLGLPFYGKQFNGTAALYTAYTAGQVTYLGYSDIVTLRQTQSGWTYVWDAVSRVPYLKNSSLPAFLTYDDSTSIDGKCQYAKQKGLAGISIWEITQDVLASGQPLLQAVAAALAPTSSVAMHGQPAVPSGTLLVDNYPNPFNPETTIDVVVPESGNVRLAVIDLLGREVALLLNERKEAGTYSVRFDGRNRATGVYYVVLMQKERRVVHPIALIR
jgi:chitinase